MVVLSIKERWLHYLAICTFVFGCLPLILLRGNMLVATVPFTLAYFANAAISTYLCIRFGAKSLHLKAHWALLAVTMGASVVVAIAALVMRTVPLIANFANFFMFCGYIPPLLLISLPAGRRYFHQFLWIDLVQVMLAMYVGYAILFRARPFTHDVPVALDGVTLFHLFLAGDLILIMGAFLHTIAAANGDEKGFFRLFFVLGVLGTAGTFLHNAILLHNPKETLTGIPVLLTGFLDIEILLRYRGEAVAGRLERGRGLLADLINIASPAFPPAVLLALGIVVEGAHPTLGHGAILTAFFLFVARATFYQRNFERLHSDLENAQVRLKYLSLTDELTSVANRRALGAALQADWDRSVRSGSPLSFLLIDVDFFKQVNDRYGHKAGDDYLIAIARALEVAVLRSIDTIGRYGGDEFAVILPNTDVAAAAEVAERICREVSDLHIENSATSTGFATLSIGVATAFPCIGPTAEGLLRDADSALYDAKKAGRNCWRATSQIIL